MALRLYLAPRTSDGRIHNVLRDIVPHLRFEEIKNDADMMGLCLVDADDAAHATLEADQRVIPLTKAGASVGDLAGDLGAAVPTRIRNALSSQSVTDGATLRDALALLARRFVHRDVDARIARNGLRVGGVQL